VQVPLCLLNSPSCYKTSSSSFLGSQVCKSEEAGVDEFCVTHFPRKTFHSLSKMLGWVRGGESVEYEARQATIPEGYPSE